MSNKAVINQDLIAQYWPKKEGEEESKAKEIFSHFDGTTGKNGDLQSHKVTVCVLVSDEDDFFLLQLE